MRRARPLKFADFLRRLPPAILFERVVQDQDSGRKIISSALIDEIIERFMQPEELRERFESLSNEARAVCVLAYLSGASGVRALEDAALHQELVNSFLVYAALDENGVRFYFGFEDMAPALEETLASWAERAGKTPAEDSAISHFLWRSVNDFAVFLALAYQGAVSLTTKGAPIRAAINQVQKVFHGMSCDGQAHDESDIRALIELHMAFGKRIGCLAVHGKEVIVSRANAEAWLCRDVREQYDELREHAFEIIGSWRMVLLDSMLSGMDDGWFSVSAFSHVQEQAFPALRTLAYVGAIELVDHNGNLLIRSARQRSAGAQASGSAPMALPDFSVLLPQECAAETLFAFSALGQYQSFDRVYKGKIDREAVNNALADEFDSERMVSLLESWRAPDNVLATVREWIREFSRLSQSAADILVSADERTSMQVETFEPIRQCLEPVHAHRVYRIKAGYARRVREMLANMGYDPRLPKHRELPSSGSAVEQLGAGERELLDGLRVETEFAAAPPADKPRISLGKYSADLKELELTELFHVIDYAILMGYYLKVDYEGSPYIKSGHYRLLPSSISKGIDPTVEGAVEPTRKMKRFYIKRITRIGVEQA